MNRENLTQVIFAEMLRLELPRANEELLEQYTDGGRASGVRNTKLAQAAADAYAQTNAALTSIAD